MSPSFINPVENTGQSPDPVALALIPFGVNEVHQGRDHKGVAGDMFGFRSPLEAG